jgi:hypothetical protein
MIPYLLQQYFYHIWHGFLNLLPFVIISSPFCFCFPSLPLKYYNFMYVHVLDLYMAAVFVSWLRKYALTSTLNSMFICVFLLVLLFFNKNIFIYFFNSGFLMCWQKQKELSGLRLICVQDWIVTLLAMFPWQLPSDLSEFVSLSVSNWQ